MGRGGRTSAAARFATGLFPKRFAMAAAALDGSAI